MTKEEAAEFYKEHEGSDYFDSLCSHMSRSVSQRERERERGGGDSEST